MQTEASSSLAADELSNLDYSLKRISEQTNCKWVSGDGLVGYYKAPEGWAAHARRINVQPAMEAVGLSLNKPFSFSSLREAREAVQAVFEEENLPLSLRLTRPSSYASYQIGSLPLSVNRFFSNWITGAVKTPWRLSFWRLSFAHDGRLPIELSAIFPEGFKEFEAAWDKTGLAGNSYATREQALKDVKNWLEGIAKCVPVAPPLVGAGG